MQHAMCNSPLLWYDVGHAIGQVEPQLPASCRARVAPGWVDVAAPQADWVHLQGMAQ